MTYTFTQYFYKVFTKNTGLNLDEDTRALISMICSTTEPHKKIDEKNRPSAYWTMDINGTKITVVGDYKQQKLVTAVKETRNRPQYSNLNCHTK